MEMFNIETGQWLIPDSSCCISPDLQCCTALSLGLAGLRIELAGLGQNWLDRGKKQAKGQTASIAFYQIWCSILLSPLGDIQKKMWCIYLGDLLRKKNWLYLRVFPPSGVIRGVFHIIHYSAHSV